MITGHCNFVFLLIFFFLSLFSFRRAGLTECDDIMICHLKVSAQKLFMLSRMRLAYGVSISSWNGFQDWKWRELNFFSSCSWVVPMWHVVAEQLSQTNSSFCVSDQQSVGLESRSCPGLAQVSSMCTVHRVSRM